MTAHNRDTIIAAAKECGYWSGQTVEMNDVGIERFYAIAFEAGRQAGINDAAETSRFAAKNGEEATRMYEAIRARGDTK